jgi:hypothetical protein
MTICMQSIATVRVGSQKGARKCRDIVAAIVVHEDFAVALLALRNSHT